MICFEDAILRRINAGFETRALELSAAFGNLKQGNVPGGYTLAAVRRKSASIADNSAAQQTR